METTIKFVVYIFYRLNVIGFSVSLRGDINDKKCSKKCRNYLVVRYTFIVTIRFNYLIK